MSIFKDTFKQGVQDQIRARQKAIAVRTPGSIQYYNSRNAWIRMTSAVNVNGSDDLAKKHILQGGILFNNKLRSGIGNTGNESYSTSSPGGNTNRLGIRPMPGITGIDVKSKSAYGSLREVTVNYLAWDIRQLEDLELLYMRPGYSVLIEWGWTPYLDNNGVLQNNINFYPDFFKPGKTKEEIWEETHDKSAKDGNYEAMYGFVKNYSWSARADGGYDCTTTIISIGEILESLKINYGAFDTSLSNKQGVFGTSLSAPQSTERIIGGGTLAGVPAVSSTSAPPTNPIANYYSQNIVAGICAELRYILTSNPISSGEGAYTVENPKNRSIKYNFLKFVVDVKNSESDNNSPSSAQIYITLDSFAQILNNHVLLKGTNDQGNGEPIVKISTKDRDNNDLLCLGNIFQVSTDPTVCFIINKAYENPQDTLGITGREEGSFSYIQKIMGFKNTQNYFYNNDFKDKQLGIIGNIYVNLDFLINLATNNNLASQDKKEKNDIAVFDYLKNVMSGINTAIGNLANFDIHVDPTNSIARIIDVNYVDTKSRQEAYDQAFLFEMQKVGPASGSVIRNYKLESQIFPEQSTIVAIGAQVQGGALGSNSNTLIDFNKNLTDRIIPKKEAPSSINSTDPQKEIQEKAVSLVTNIKSIIQFLTDLTPGWLTGNEYDANNKSKYANALKDIINFYLSYTSVNTKNRGIIPTKLSLETDGIGGIIIGNLFRIPNEILPKGYKGNDANTTESVGARIGYTVTGLGHSIQNNDWVTRIDSQFIVLDEPKGSLTTEQFLELAKEINKIASTGNIENLNQALQIKIAPTTTSSGDLNYPIVGSYRLTSPSLTPRTNPVTGEFQAIHGGSDLAVPINTPVYAVDDGIVEYAGQQNLLSIRDGAGIYVRIRHTGNFNGKTTLSMHLNSAAVAKGVKVKKGQIIGYSGNTGSSTGPHLHFEIRESATQTKLKVSDFFPGF
jgi:murein DD-endopeptidase MepM/ murein hydrolase activator NlpD